MSHGEFPRRPRPTMRGYVRGIAPLQARRMQCPRHGPTTWLSNSLPRTPRRPFRGVRGGTEQASGQRDRADRRQRRPGGHRARHFPLRPRRHVQRRRDRAALRHRRRMRRAGAAEHPARAGALLDGSRASPAGGVRTPAAGRKLSPALHVVAHAHVPRRGPVREPPGARPGPAELLERRRLRHLLSPCSGGPTPWLT